MPKITPQPTTTPTTTTQKPIDYNALNLPKPRHPGGRPTKYSKQLAVALCTLVARGYTIRTLTKHKSMPSMTTLFRWYSNPVYTEFRELYERARRFQAIKEADEMLDLADSADAKNAHAIRVQMDARKWRCERFNRAAFGDVKQVNVSGTVDHKHAVLVQHVDDTIKTIYNDELVQITGPTQDDRGPKAEQKQAGVGQDFSGDE